MSTTESEVAENVVRVLILGTGLIGASLGLALKKRTSTFGGRILGWDSNPAELQTALDRGAIDEALPGRDAVLTPGLADVYVLAVPVLPILDWMEHLSGILKAGQLLTDVGSTKGDIVRSGERLFGGADTAEFLPSHPMAGKEAGGAALADAALFEGATWLFIPGAGEGSSLSRQWRGWIAEMGAQAREIGPSEHDQICGWVSHLPQMLSTALAALLEETFAGDAEGRALVEAIGGRALRETTRLGASPYSMWRDVAMTNTEVVASTLLALEQRLQAMREGLREPELRDAFRLANRFCAKRTRT